MLEWGVGGSSNSLSAALTLGFGVVACSSRDSSDSKSSASSGSSSGSDEGQWPCTVKTDDRNLTLDSKPKRIISTLTTLTGSLLAIDAPVVASAETVSKSTGLSDDQGFFEQWSKKPRTRSRCRAMRYRGSWCSVTTQVLLP